MYSKSALMSRQNFSYSYSLAMLYCSRNLVSLSVWSVPLELSPKPQVLSNVVQTTKMSILDHLELVQVVA